MIEHAKNSPRKRVKTWWQEHHWVVVGLLAGVSFALGFVGFRKHFAATPGETRSALDLFYCTIQLFTMESGSVRVQANPALEAARFLAPLVSSYAVLQALLVIFRERLRLFGLRYAKDHVVICGLGHKGARLAGEFLDQGRRVVIIEEDAGNSLLGFYRELGATVLLGDATDPEVLQEARVDRAKSLIAVCGDDGVNAEIAVHARRAVAGANGGTLTCLLHIVNPQLCDLLREIEIGAEDTIRFRMVLFNVFDSGARALLNRYPLFEEGSGAVSGSSPNMVVVGLGDVGKSLVAHAAKHWRPMRAEGAARLRISLVDSCADKERDALLARYPDLEEICELTVQHLDVCSPQFQGASGQGVGSPGGNATRIYVCLEDDSRGLSVALGLFRQTRYENVPIVVTMADDAGLAALLQGAGSSPFRNLHAFGLLDRTCTPELLLGGTIESLARAIHDDYMLQEERKGNTAAVNASMVPWKALPEHLKESNRSQADHIMVKLRAVGCALAAAREWEPEQFAFTHDEIELLAKMEHERWAAERSRTGWKYASGPKNVDAKTTPYLIGWDELSDDIKELDRNTIRSLPSFLAKAGFRIYRAE